MEKEELWKLYKRLIEDSTAVSNRVCDFFFSQGDKFIVGTGRQAAVVMELCRNFKTDIAGLIPEQDFLDSVCVTGLYERKGYWRECIDALPVIRIADFKSNANAQFILTVEREKYDLFERSLMTRGFSRDNIFGCDWNHNYDLRKICYEVYKEEYNQWQSCE